MSEDEKQEPKLISPKLHVLNAALTVVFFFYMRGIFMNHVPSLDPDVINLVASFTALCLAGVFWMAAGMLAVTWVDWARAKEAAASE